MLCAGTSLLAHELKLTDYETRGRIELSHVVELEKQPSREWESPCFDHQDDQYCFISYDIERLDCNAATFAETFLHRYKALFSRSTKEQLPETDVYAYHIDECFYSFGENCYYQWNKLDKPPKVDTKNQCFYKITFRFCDFQKYYGGVITGTTFHKGQSSLKFTQFLITAANNNGSIFEVENMVIPNSIKGLEKCTNPKLCQEPSSEEFKCKVTACYLTKQKAVCSAPPRVGGIDSKVSHPLKEVVPFQILSQKMGRQIQEQIGLLLSQKALFMQLSFYISNDAPLIFAKTSLHGVQVDGSSSNQFAFIVQVKAYYVEEAKPKVEAPPPMQISSLQDVTDENSRVETFRGRRLPVRNFTEMDFAKAGFYLSGDAAIICFSCRIQLNVFEVTSHPSDPQWHQHNCHHISLLRSSSQAVRSDTPGRILDDVTEPPGQHTLYIPPGDICREIYRLSTFEHFPIATVVFRRNLAKSGFYFTGYQDRVKCFACTSTVQQWSVNDNPSDRRWHRSDCPLLRGEASGNLPLLNHFEFDSISTSNLLTTAVSARHPDSQSHPNLLPQHNGAVAAGASRYSNDIPQRNNQIGVTDSFNQTTTQTRHGSPTQNPADRRQQPAPPVTRRQWRMANVVSSDHKRFLTNLYLNRQLDRLASFSRWPVGRPNIAPAYLARSGFFYLGDMDRTQCFSCGGVLRNWKLEDDADAEHRAHFPQCQMVLGTEDRNIPVHEHPETEEERERKYPCRFPSNPHMRSESSRLATFDQRWPITRTAATPPEIAQAGFFFLGERDRAKCWYCNGGLQNWEYDDIPWIEHAKWFPNCQYLLRVKGQHFVYRHLAVNPHLARPIIARQDGSPLENVGQPAQSSQRQAPRSRDVAPNVHTTNRPDPTPVIIDPQAEMRRRKKRVEDLIKNSDIVKFVISMGFDPNTVATVLEDKINSDGGDAATEMYESASDLLDDVNKKIEEINREKEETHNQMSASSMGEATSIGVSGTSGAASMTSLSSSTGFSKYNVLYNDDEDDEERMDQDLYESTEGILAACDPAPARQLQEGENDSESLRIALEAMNEEKLCKICFSNQADMVFVPCSHLCCCMECTQAITQCPLCRKPIQKAMKVYLK